MVTPTLEKVEMTGLPQPAEKWKRRRLEREAVVRDEGGGAGGGGV